MSTPSLRMANAEPRWLRWTLTAIGLAFLFLFLALPLLAVFYEALAGGWSAYLPVSYTHLTLPTSDLV